MARRSRYTPPSAGAVAAFDYYANLAHSNPFAYESQLVDTGAGWDFKQNGRKRPAKKVLANKYAYESQLFDTGEGWDIKTNPVGKTIEARRHGTCSITGDHISPGDSITKTDDGWALSEHPNLHGLGGDGAGMVAGQRAARQRDRQRAGHRKLPAIYENPSMGGAAMRYAREHGVSLKEGWKAVKAGMAERENPSQAGAAMRYARSHGVSLKEGWKAVKRGKR